jgi:seipin
MPLDSNNTSQPGSSTLVRARNAVPDSAEAARSRLVSPTLTGTVLRLVFFCLLTTASIVIGTLAYVAFYNTYIPVRGMVAPVWLQYGFGRPPFAVVDLKAHKLVFAEDQPYAITLELVVPANERNIDLGLLA